MYFGGSVVAKASTVGREILPIPLLIFTGVKKYKIWCHFQHRSALKMQQDIQILKQKCHAAMIALCRGQVW